MRISQYVYFGIDSETVPATTVTERLGMAPDKVLVRGAKRAAPPVPRFHAWDVVCRDKGLTVDEQITQVLARVGPLQEKLAELIRDLDVSAFLVVVRYFDDEEGEPELDETVITKDGSVLEKLPGQHQLLGWTLTAEQLAFLAAVQAGLVVDEYG